MVSKSSSYHDALLESLIDPHEAQLYLNAVLEDYPEGFLKALRNVAQARQMSKVAEQAGIKRESLYRALSNEGNPTLTTFTSILNALGLKLSIAIPGTPEIATPSPAHPDFQLKETSTAGVPKSLVVAKPETEGKVVDISIWKMLAPIGQKNREHVEKSTNEPTLQEALCK